LILSAQWISCHDGKLYYVESAIASRSVIAAQTSSVADSEWEGQ